MDDSAGNKSRKTKILPRDVHFNMRRKVRETINEIKALVTKNASYSSRQQGANIRELMERALQKRYGHKAAHEITFHLMDWAGEADFLVVLLLFPKLLTMKEIECAVSQFLGHAPHHIAAAAQHIGHPVSDCFEIGVSIRSRKPMKKI